MAKNTEKLRKSRRFTEAQVIKAIQGTGGIVSQICERLSCDRRTVYNYIKDFPEIKKAYEDEKDVVLDIAEEGLISKIYSQEFDAIRYYLDKKGHSRGYAVDNLNPDADSEAQPVKVVIEVKSARKKDKSIGD